MSVNLRARLLIPCCAFYARGILFPSSNPSFNHLSSLLLPRTASYARGKLGPVIRDSQVELLLPHCAFYVRGTLARTATLSEWRASPSSVTKFESRQKRKVVGLAPGGQGSLSGELVPLWQNRLNVINGKSCGGGREGNALRVGSSSLSGNLRGTSTTSSIVLETELKVL